MSDYLLCVESAERVLSSRSTCSVARSRVDSEALFLRLRSVESCVGCQDGECSDGPGWVTRCILGDE